MRILGVNEKNHFIRDLLLSTEQVNSTIRESPWFHLSVVSTLILTPTFKEFNPSIEKNNQEAYTPLQIINYIRSYCKHIDVDAAGNYLTSRHIYPVVYYSKHVDGLDTNNIWFGNVLCNPPFSSGDSKLIPRWVDRVRAEILSNDKIENIFLLLYNPKLKTKWLQGLLADSKREVGDKLKCEIFKLASFNKFKPYDNGYFYTSIGNFSIYHYSVSQKGDLMDRDNEYMEKVTYS